MSSKNRRAGIATLQVNGKVYDMVGDFSWNLGNPKREPLMGPSGMQGFSEMPQSPFIEGEIRDSGGLDLNELQNITDATITLRVANGKTILFSEAFYSADGNVGTNEANVQFNFNAMNADVLAA